VGDLLGGPTRDGDGWTFDFGEHLESNWGAIYGGALSAACISVARAVLPGRAPHSLHVQIPRSVPRGLAYATADVRHEGRTVATVQIDLYEARKKLAVTALVTMVAPDAVAVAYDDTTANQFDRRPRQGVLAAVAPVQRTFDMLTDPRDGAFTGWYVENGRRGLDGAAPPSGHITLPWDDLTGTGPEAACLSADAAIAPPLVYTELVPNEVLGPNPDLSLRFACGTPEREVLSAGTLLSLHAGTATVAIEVQSGANQLAHGLATALLLPPR
jgi:acyl-coenzyme A thioesterase PaaI-like protein